MWSHGAAAAHLAPMRSLAKVADSPVHGKGLFARHRIKEGDVVVLCDYMEPNGGARREHLQPALKYLNHCCEPNVREGQYDADFNRELIALRPIAKGEELSITYMGTAFLVGTVLERVDYLLAFCGFECKCAKCEGPPGF